MTISEFAHAYRQLIDSHVYRVDSDLDEATRLWKIANVDDIRCPITAVCEMLHGTFYTVNRWEAAALVLRLNLMTDASQIMRQADNLGPTAFVAWMQSLQALSNT